MADLRRRLGSRSFEFPAAIGAVAVLAVTATSAIAEPPVIVNVDVAGSAIHVTLSHADTGWDHYADLWQVFDTDGNKIAERVLLHPHVNEQPFTRSTGIYLPEGLTGLTVIASCTDGDSSEPYVLTLE